jgi:hypothetical protein
MSLSTTVAIGDDLVDINRPCDVVTALRKMQLRLSTAEVRETVRIDGEEVTFQRGNDQRLVKLIAQYEATCTRAQGKGRRRYAKRISFY